MKKSQFPHKVEKKLRRILNLHTKKLILKMENKENIKDIDDIDFSRDEKKQILNDLSKVVVATNKKVFESWRTLTDEELKRTDLTGRKYWIRENYLRVNGIKDKFKEKLTTFKQDTYKNTLEKFNKSLDYRFDKLLKRKISNTDIDKLLTELKGFYAPSKEIKALINELEYNRKLNKNDIAELQAWANRRNELWARNETGNLYSEELKSLWAENGIERYVWRTMQDNRVRMEHVEKDGKVFRVDEGILPGQDFGCRCWAEPVK